MNVEILCRIRDIYRSIAEFETHFEKVYGLCLNEGMLLCSLSKEERLSSGEIAGLLNLTTSNTSKVLKSVESKGLIGRVLGDKDKRQMYFSLTAEGREKLASVKCADMVMPDMLKLLIDGR